MKNDRYSPTGPPETPLERKKRVRKRNNKILLILIGVVGLSVGSYKLYIQEYMAYRDAMTSDYLGDVEGYLYQYPDGRWVEEINDRLEEIDFEEAKRLYEINQNGDSWEAYFENHPSGKYYEEAMVLYELGSFTGLNTEVQSWINGDSIGHYPLKLITKFKDKFPNSPHLPQVEELSNSVWDFIQKSYTDATRIRKEKDGGFKFFKRALKYMQEEGMSKMYIHFRKWDNRLKDWDEYPSAARNYLDELTQITRNPREWDFLHVDSPPPSENPPISAKKQASPQRRGILESYFLDGVLADLNDLFPSPPFEIVAASKGAITEEYVNIYLDFDIHNQEFSAAGTKVPELFTLSSGFVKRTFDAYIFSLEVNGTVVGVIPNDPATLTSTFRGRPKSSLTDINGTSEAYRQLFNSTFELSGRQLAILLGLAEDKYIW